MRPPEPAPRPRACRPRRARSRHPGDPPRTAELGFLIPVGCSGSSGWRRWRSARADGFDPGPIPGALWRARRLLAMPRPRLRAPLPTPTVRPTVGRCATRDRPSRGSTASARSWPPTRRAPGRGGRCRVSTARAVRPARPSGAGARPRPYRGLPRAACGDHRPPPPASTARGSGSRSGGGQIDRQPARLPQGPDRDLPGGVPARQARAAGACRPAAAAACPRRRCPRSGRCWSSSPRVGRRGARRLRHGAAVPRRLPGDDRPGASGRAPTRSSGRACSWWDPPRWSTPCPRIQEPGRDWLTPSIDAQDEGVTSCRVALRPRRGRRAGPRAADGVPREPGTARRWCRCSDRLHFTAVATELGYIGGVGILLGFVVLIQRGFVTPPTPTDGFSQLSPAGDGDDRARGHPDHRRRHPADPATGVTLPFMSYGGSSVVTNFALVALLLITRPSASAARRHGARP